MYLNEISQIKEVIKTNYIMIPNEIILNDKINEKRVMLYSYFASKRGLDDTVGFSCDDVVKWCGYSLDYHQNKINAQMTTLINHFVEHKYIEVEGTISRNNFNRATLMHDKFDIDKQFALVYFDEIDRLKNFKTHVNDKNDTNRMNSNMLLLVLSYLRVNMLRRQKKYIGKLSDKPEFCYRMYIDIAKDIGISSRYISRAIKILDEMGYIVTQAVPRFKDDYDNWHTGVTLFANRYKRVKGGIELEPDYNYEQELQWGLDYVMNKKHANKKFNLEIV